MIDFLYSAIIWATATEKRTFWYERPIKTQISLNIRLVWSESLVSACRNMASLASQNAANEDSVHFANVQTGLTLQWVRMPDVAAHLLVFVLQSNMGPGTKTAVSRTTLVLKRLLYPNYVSCLVFVDSKLSIVYFWFSPSTYAQVFPCDMLDAHFMIRNVANLCLGFLSVFIALLTIH